MFNMFGNGANIIYINIRITDFSRTDKIINCIFIIHQWILQQTTYAQTYTQIIPFQDQLVSVQGQLPTLLCQTRTLSAAVRGYPPSLTKPPETFGLYLRNKI